jgi:hypothetical protein
VILRIVDGFEFEDLDQITKQPKLSHNQKTHNLDVLRGNQVWLKTSK